MSPDAIVYVISLPNLSARRFADMRAKLDSASALPSRLVRLEGAAPGLPDALDLLRAEGYVKILVQPIGLPFPESLLAWLPGALSTWQNTPGNEHMDLFVGQEVATSAGIVTALVEDTIAAAEAATPVRAIKPSLGKPGWQNPPDFTHHLLVCTGPRCQFRDAASLLHTLKDETARQGISNQCLTTRTGCLFPCNQGPMVALYPKGEWYRLPTREAVTRFVSDVLVAGGTASDLLIHETRKPTQDTAP